MLQYYHEQGAASDPDLGSVLFINFEISLFFWLDFEYFCRN